MNHIGTHDTERALTVLGGEPAGATGAGSGRPPSTSPPPSGRPGSGACGWPPSSSTCSPGCPASTTATRRAWRATGTPSTGPATPGAARARTCSPGTRRLGQLRAREKRSPGPGRLTAPCKGRRQPAGLRAVRPHRNHPGQPRRWWSTAATRPQSAWGAALDLEGGRLACWASPWARHQPVLPPFGYSLMKIHRDLKPKQEPEE